MNGWILFLIYDKIDVSNKKVNVMLRFLLLFFPLYIYADIYNCEVDMVKYLDTGKILPIKKEYRTNVIINLDEKKSVDITIGDNIRYILYFGETKKLLNMINTDIYVNNEIQLEIIDISNSWSTGARLFHKNRMLLISSCRK